LAPLKFFSSVSVLDYVIKIAHELAQFGRLAEDGCLGWADVAPDFVSVLAASEIGVHVY
jgi:hypothetical protein